MRKYPNDSHNDDNHDRSSDNNSNNRIRLQRPPHEQPRATWQDVIPPYRDGPLTRQQVETFSDDGVLVLPDFYTTCQIEACQRDMEQHIDELAQKLVQAKRITSNHLYSKSDGVTKLDWTERLLLIAKEDPDAPIFLSKRGILPRAFWDLYGDARMLTIAHQLGLSSDIALHPAWNIRAKMPHDETTVVPWHQDNSYWEPRLWDELVLTIWVALVPATRQNGCMQFVKRGHASGRTASHTVGTSSATWYTELAPDAISKELSVDMDITNDKNDNILTCEASPGTAILFAGTIPHRSLNSMEASVRWSTDFRLHNCIPKRSPSAGGNLDWFYGIKDSLILTTATTGDHRGDGDRSSKTKPTAEEWEKWAGLDRTEAQNDNAGVTVNEPDFDHIVVGPWMDLWTIEHHSKGLENPHIDRYLETITLKGGGNLAEEDSKLIQRYKDNHNW